MTNFSNGLLSAFLCTALGAYSLLLGKDSWSRLVQTLLLAAAPAFALLGGSDADLESMWAAPAICTFARGQLTLAGILHS